MHILLIAKRTNSDRPFVVGYRFYPRKHWGDWSSTSRMAFRSIRSGVSFKTLEKAEKFRDYIESKQAKSDTVDWEVVG